MRRILHGVFVSIITLLIIFASGETALRIFHEIRYTKQNATGPAVIKDKRLGWKSSPNYAIDTERLDSKNKPYRVKIATNKDGFRTYGDPESPRKKVFFLGDSFTHAVEVSNGKTYFDRLGEELSLEVFAYGGGGFGTLQEYMIVDEFVDQIDPDIVVLQFCDNDFLNNYYPLEYRSRRNNNGWRRPYWSGAEIVYRLPRDLPTLHAFADSSRFLNFFLSRIHRIGARYSDSVEDEIESEGSNFRPFFDSAQITKTLLAKIKARVPKHTRVIAFSVNDGSPYHEVIQQIAKDTGIEFVDGVAQAVKADEAQGASVRVADGAHWNNEGHRIASDVLAAYLRGHP